MIAIIKDVDVAGHKRWRLSRLGRWWGRWYFERDGYADDYDDDDDDDDDDQLRP